MEKQTTNESINTIKFENKTRESGSNSILHDRASIFAETVTVTTFSYTQEQLIKNVNIDKKDLDQIGK